MRTVLLLLLLVMPAWADDAPPSEDLKKALLKEAYHLNGDSMIRWGCIDMSNPIAGPVACPMPVPPDPKVDSKRPGETR
jgi:hypothetical protein